MNEVKAHLNFMHTHILSHGITQNLSFLNKQMKEKFFATLFDMSSSNKSKVTTRIKESLL